METNEATLRAVQGEHRIALESASIDLSSRQEVQHLNFTTQTHPHELRAAASRTLGSSGRVESLAELTLRNDLICHIRRTIRNRDAKGMRAGSWSPAPAREGKRPACCSFRRVAGRCVRRSKAWIQGLLRIGYRRGYRRRAQSRVPRCSIARGRDMRARRPGSQGRGWGPRNAPPRFYQPWCDASSKVLNLGVAVLRSPSGPARTLTATCNQGATGKVLKVVRPARRALIESASVRASARGFRRCGLSRRFV